MNWKRWMIAGLLIIVVGSGCGYGAERRTDQKTEEIKEPESEENRKEDSLRLAERLRIFMNRKRIRKRFRKLSSGRLESRDMRPWIRIIRSIW